LKVNKGINRLTTLLFTIYLVGLYWILLFKLGIQSPYMDERRVNLIPFNDPSLFNAENILNVIIFVPLGIYAGIIFERLTSSKKILLFFSASLIVEALQYILRLGAFDVTDLITNTAGGILGLIIFKSIERVFNNSDRAQRFINIFAATGTILIVLLLLLLKMNLLPVRFQ